jgi:hypothetical protein
MRAITKGEIMPAIYMYSQRVAVLGSESLPWASEVCEACEVWNSGTQPQVKSLKFLKCLKYMKLLHFVSSLGFSKLVVLRARFIS